MGDAAHQKICCLLRPGPRAEYWWFYLGTIIVQIPLTFADKALADWGPLSSLFGLATLVPWLSVTVRRLHDTNRSGWWLFALFAPLVVIGGAVGMATAAGLTDETDGWMVAMIIVLAIAMFIILIVSLLFMVREGTPGPNDYGDDPYGPNSLEEVFA